MEQNLTADLALSELSMICGGGDHRVRASEALADLRAAISTERTARISAEAQIASLTEERDAARHDLGRLQLASAKLEAACDHLAAVRTQKIYDEMIREGQAEALLDLDAARVAVRQLIALSPTQQEG